MHAERSAQTNRYRIRCAGREIDVPPCGLVVGRGTDCGLQLAGGLVSRRHARFWLSGDSLHVEDLGSRNGVVVNRRKIDRPVALSHGDTVAIGVEVLDVVDDHVVVRPAHLSTLPPTGIAPYGESDVDVPDAQLQTTVARVDILSDREREVLEHIVLGHTQREIAEKLFVSVKTIETHRAHIADKLGCRTRAEMVSYAISAGLLGNALRAR